MMLIILRTQTNSIAFIWVLKLDVHITEDSAANELTVLLENKQTRMHKKITQLLSANYVFMLNHLMFILCTNIDMLCLRYRRDDMINQSSLCLGFHVDV